MAGEIPACKWVRLACQRQLGDMERKDLPYRFSREHANRLCEFIELLPHVKGRWGSLTIKLEPWQIFTLCVVFGWIDAEGNRRFRTVYIEVPRKNAKALAIDTPIATPLGWTTMGAVSVGDAVFDEAGKPCTVTAVTEVLYGHACYRLRFSDGAEIVADAGHQWLTDAKIVGRSLKGIAKSEWRNRLSSIRTTEEIARTIIAGKRRDRNHSIRVAGALQCHDVELPIPPYVLGVWLGDGLSDSGRFVCSHKDVQIVENVRLSGVECSLGRSPSKSTGLYRLGSGSRGKERFNSIQSRLRSLGVLKNKHIPAIYMRASVSQRTELLRGLMDTDGTVSKAGQCSYTSTSRRLADDVYDLLVSLGFKPSIISRVAKCNGKVCGTAYRIQFWAFSDRPVFRLYRKAIRQKRNSNKFTRSSTRQIVECVQVESVPVKCIEVDSPSRLYLAGKALIPTHNSTLSSAVGNYLVAADKELGAEVYSLATTRDQARIVFDDARAMAKLTPALQEHLGLEVLAHAIAVPRSNSTFKALSSDANTLDGLNIHGAIVDEFHAHQTRAVWDVVNTATGARKQALKWIITTAGFNRAGVCYEQREYVCKILDGVFQDESYYGIIYTIDAEDDWTTEEAWRKANPNYGVSVLPDDIATLCRQAMLSAQSQNNFLTKRLNVWVSADTAWMNMQAWDACADHDLRLEKFEGAECWIGLDLAAKIDIAAKAYLFRRDGKIYVFGRYYLPEDLVEQGINTNAAHYSGWARQGRMVLTPGNITDYEYIKEDLREDMRRFKVKCIAYDPFQAQYLATQLLAERAPMVEYGATVKNFSEPMKDIEALVLSRGLIHDGCPVATWMMSNVVAHRDQKDNIFPRKERPENKIDWPVALMAARGMHMRQSQLSTVYATRGLLTV